MIVKWCSINVLVAKGVVGFFKAKFLDVCNVSIDCMFDLAIRRKSRLGVSVLLAAVMLYGNLSCQKAVQEKRYTGNNFEKNRKSVVGSSVIEKAPRVSETVESSESAVSDKNQDPGDILDCLTTSRVWKVDGGDAFKRRFCKLICVYLTSLIERSADDSSFQDPVLSLESLRQFLAEQGVQLKIRKVTDPDGSGSSSIGGVIALLM